MADIHGLRGVVAVFAYRLMWPFPLAGSRHAFDVGPSHGRAAVHDRDADMDFRHLKVWIWRDDPIAKQREAVHQGFDTISDMIPDH